MSELAMIPPEHGPMHDVDVRTAEPRRLPDGEIDPNIEFLAKLLDDIFVIPGTNLRLGLDGIIGLIPGVGDVATLIVAGFVMREAQRHKVSGWTKAHMYGNYLLDTVVGLIPFAGDLFDIGFKAHRRNVRILQEHIRKQQRKNRPSR